MKVEIRFTVEVDSEAWANEYGVELNEVRADVKTYYENVVASTYPGQNGLAS